jgi:hypothetical protein
MTKRRQPRNYLGKIPTVLLPVTFEAGKGFVTAVIHIDNSTIGLKFESPEQLLTFFTELMENATLAWPDNPFIKLYLSDENEQ